MDDSAHIHHPTHHARHHHLSDGGYQPRVEHLDSVKVPNIKRCDLMFIDLIGLFPTNNIIAYQYYNDNACKNDLLGYMRKDFNLLPISTVNKLT